MNHKQFISIKLSPDRHLEVWDGGSLVFRRLLPIAGRRWEIVQCRDPPKSALRTPLLAGRLHNCGIRLATLQAGATAKRNNACSAPQSA